MMAIGDKNQINVVHVITGLSTGGAETALYNLLNKADREKFKLSVISLMDKGNYGEKIESLGIPVFELNMKRGHSSVFAFFRLMKVIRAINPDIIQSWMYHANIACFVANAVFMWKVSIIWNIRHSVYDLKFEKKSTAIVIRIGAVFSRFVTKIIFNSQLSARQHQALGYMDSGITVIPNGFDCARFHPFSADHIRKTLDIKSSDIIIGLIARYHPMKDHKNFFEAAGILSQKYQNIVFVLAGRGVDSENSALMQFIDENNLSQRVRLLGERQDIAALNNMLDIASLSSYSEGFPNIIGEAMACGVPCVVTDVGDSAYLVGDTGIVVPVRNPVALADAWIQLIEAGETQRLKQGQRARQRIMDYFSLEEIVNRYEALYESVFRKNNTKLKSEN